MTRLKVSKVGEHSSPSWKTIDWKPFAISHILLISSLLYIVNVTSKIMYIDSIIELLIVTTIGLDGVIGLVFGSLFGILFLLWMDPQRRLQAISLTFISTVYCIQFFLISPIQYASVASGTYLFSLSAGCVTVLLAVLSYKNSRNFFGSYGTSLRVYAVLAVTVVAIIFVESHLQYELVADGVTTFGPIRFQFAISNIRFVTESIGVDSVVLFVFSRSLFYVLGFRSGTSIATIGPSQSGKTTLLIGLYRAGLRSSGYEMSSSTSLVSMFRSLGSDEGYWPPETGGVSNYKLAFWQSGVFARYLEVSTVDYNGVLLSGLPDYLTGNRLGRRHLDYRTVLLKYPSVIVIKLLADIKDLFIKPKYSDVNPREVNDSENKNNKMKDKETIADIHTLRQKILGSDTMLFIVDANYLLSDSDYSYQDLNRLIISNYHPILNITSPRRSIVVVTKADLLLDDYYESTDSEKFDYDHFRMYVQERITSESAAVENLIFESSLGIVQPVFYRTEEVEDGINKPVIPIETEGFDQLLDNL